MKILGYYLLLLFLLLSCQRKTYVVGVNPDMTFDNKNYEEEELTFIEFNNQAIYLPKARKKEVFNLIKEDTILQRLINDPYPEFSHGDARHIPRERMIMKDSYHRCPVPHHANSLICIDHEGIPLFSKFIDGNTSYASSIKCQLYRNMNLLYEEVGPSRKVECFLLKFNVTRTTN